MITINLLPEELRPRRAKGFSLQGAKIFEASEFRFEAIAIGIVVLLFALQALLFPFQAANRFRAAALREEYSGLGSKKSGIDTIKNKIESIKKQAPLIDKLTVRDRSWAEMLNVISDSMTPGVWLAELSYKEEQAAKGAAGDKKGSPPAEIPAQRSLILSGYAYSASEDPTTAISRFIKSLKGDRMFSEHFKNVAVEDIKGEKFDAQEVMAFKIICSFKE